MERVSLVHLRHSLIEESVSLGVADVVKLNRGHLFFFTDYLMNRSDK